MTNAAARPLPDAQPGRSRDALRARIVSAAADLLTRGGRDALTTRTVAAEAGVQAPTIYRLFGDKDGLIDAVAEHGYAAYLAGKQPHPAGLDPVGSLRAGWDLHVGFGLANPALYALMYGDPRPGRTSPAAEYAEELLRAQVRRLAAAGRLRIAEPRAVNLIQAAARGTVLTLLALPEELRDAELSADVREAVLAALAAETSFADTAGARPAAITLRAELPDVTALTERERGLMDEWLNRIITG
jgi:AcrR family transcriptional regulator